MRNRFELGDWRDHIFKILIIFLVVTAGYFLFFWQLGDLPAGLSASELAAIDSSLGWQQLVNYPINLPHKVLVYMLHNIDGSIYTSRLPSAVFASLFLILFYIMIKLWFGRLIASLGVLLLACSPLAVVLSRSATASILLLAPISFATAYLWLAKRERFRSLAWISLCIFAALSLYVPGLIWVVALSLVMVGKRLLGMTKTINQWAVAVGFGLFILLLLPLVLAAVRMPSLLLDIGAIPNDLDGPITVAKSFIWTLASLVWQQPTINEFSVGRLPVLSLAMCFMAIFGAYALWSKARSVVYWLMLVFGSSIGLATLNTNVVYLLPATMVACVLAAAGLRYLFVEWNSVFPKNPIPRGLALILMVMVVGANLAYGVRLGLFAWPNTPESKEIHVLEYPVDKE